MSFHSQHQSMLLIIEIERYIRVYGCLLLYPALHMTVTGSMHSYWYNSILLYTTYIYIYIYIYSRGHAHMYKCICVSLFTHQYIYLNIHILLFHKRTVILTGIQHCIQELYIYIYMKTYGLIKFVAFVAGHFRSKCGIETPAELTMGIAWWLLAWSFEEIPFPWRETEHRDFRGFWLRSGISV